MKDFDVPNGRDEKLRLTLDGEARRGRVDRFERTRPSLHDVFLRIANPAEEEANEAND